VSRPNKRKVDRKGLVFNMEWTAK